MKAYQVIIRCNHIIIIWNHHNFQHSMPQLDRFRILESSTNIYAFNLTKSGYQISLLICGYKGKTFHSLWASSWDWKFIRLLALFRTSLKPLDIILQWRLGFHGRQHLHSLVNWIPKQDDTAVSRTVETPDLCSYSNLSRLGLTRLKNTETTRREIFSDSC